MSTSDNLLSEEEAAESIGRARKWLRARRLSGEGPAFIMLGNKVHYDRADIDEWLNSLKQRPEGKSK